MMEIGAVFPHIEIGADPGAIRTFAQARAPYRGGNPERGSAHAQQWRELGCTHLAIAIHHAGRTDVDGHLGRVTDYLQAVE